MEPVVLLLLALALLAYLDGRRVRCGVLIGCAASLKLAPLLLVLLLLRRRWWRAGAASLGAVLATTAAGVLALGTGPLVEYVTKVMPALARQNGWLYNQSLSGALNRAAGHAVLTVQPPIPALAVSAVLLSVAVVAATLWLARPEHVTRSRRGIEFSCMVMAMLLAGTITWYLHYVLLLIPLLAVAGWLAIVRPPLPRLLVGALCACLLAVAVAGPFLADARFVNLLLAQRGTTWWWPLLQLSSLPVLSVALLFIATAATLRKTESTADRTAVLSPRRVSAL